MNLEFALSEKPIELDSNPRKEKHDYAGRHGGGRRVGPGGRHRGAGHPEGGEASHAGSHSRINSGWIIDTHRKRITVTSVSGNPYRGTILKNMLKNANFWQCFSGNSEHLHFMQLSPGSLRHTIFS